MNVRSLVIVRLQTFACALLLPGVLFLNSRSLAFAVLGQVLTGVAIKLVQGLAMVHGLRPVEIDHRNGRYRSGKRVLGDNARDSYGTLLGCSVSMGGDVDGRPGFDVVAGGYEYSDQYEGGGLVLLWGVGHLPLKILGPRQHRAWFGHPVANNGDFDGDGIADVLFGARFANNRAGLPT